MRLMKYLIVFVGIILLAGLAFILFAGDKDSILTGLAVDEPQTNSELMINETINDDYANVVEPHYTHMPITYKIKHPEECVNGLDGRIKLALSIIESDTDGVVRFQEDINSADMEIDCINLDKQLRDFSLNQTCEDLQFKLSDNSTSENLDGARSKIDKYIKDLEEKGFYIYNRQAQVESNKLYEIKLCYINRSKFEYTPEEILEVAPQGEGYIVEGLAKPSIEGSIILNSTVQLFVHNPRCMNFPYVEIHEILHAFNFAHKKEDKDIMSPIISLYFKDCASNKKLNEEYIRCLKKIYSNGMEESCDGVNFLEWNITNVTKNNTREVIDPYAFADIPHWTHMPLTYKYEDKEQCYPIRIERNEIAMREIEKLTNGTVRFIVTEGAPDINFKCTKFSNIEEGSQTVGDNNITYYPEKPDVIEKAEISLFGGADVECEPFPMTESFEILSSLGINSSVNSWSVMSDYVDCSAEKIRWEIDGPIFMKLENIYKAKAN